MTDFEKYIIARWAYSVGEPIITDAEYTVLHNAMMHKYPQDPYCDRSWSSDPCPVDLLKKYGYRELIQAVVLADKTESIPSLNTIYDVHEMYGKMNTVHSLSYKLDGWNTQASYYNGSLINVQSRGRARDVIDMNALAPKFPQKIDMDGKVLITAECTVPNDQYQWFIDHYGNKSQRGAVSTAIANARNCMDHIAVHAHGIRCAGKVENKFELLRSLGFEVPMYTYVSDYDTLIQTVKKYSDYKGTYGLLTDGVVIEGEMTKALRIYGWEEPIHTSFVTGYAESYGPHSIAVKCEIYPIRMQNSTQSIIPVTNLSRIIKNNLRIGHPIAFKTISAAIADLEENATRLLQEEWAGREGEYQQLVKAREVMKY